MNHNTTNDQLSSSSDNHDVSSRRASSRISSKEIASPRRRSTARSAISKKSTSRNSRKSSKGTPQTRKKQIQNHLDLESEMDYSNNDQIDDSNLDDNQEDDEQNLLNMSTASADTVIMDNANRKKTSEKTPTEYFGKPNDNGKVQCSICSREYIYNQFSDSNLRSHLGFKHGLYKFLYPSQLKQRDNNEKKPPILPHLKKQLDAAAIKCIVKDGLSFGTFRRDGMQEFLSTIKPGYRGPSRQTVRKHLDKLYQERRSFLKEKFKTIPFISLTTDIWMNSRRHHFLVITAHYHDEHYQLFSDVISFRCFRGRHLAIRLKKFLLNEIKKLNIESKIFSITTDNGSDIKSATSSQEFGIRFSCDAHNINRTISTGLDLWKKTSKSKNNESTLSTTSSSSTTTATSASTSTTTTASNEYYDEFDDEIEKQRSVDIGVTFDEWINIDENNDDDEGDENYVPTLGDEDDSDSGSDSSDDENDSVLTSSQQDRRTQDEEEDEQVQQLLSNSAELKKRISTLLKKIRKLVKLINKSSILTSFFRNEIKRRDIDLDAEINPGDKHKVKVLDLTNDFHIRWNSTFIMLARVWAAQQILTDITYSPQSHIGLTAKQVRKLRSFQNDHLEWELIKSLANILAPFYFATKSLCGRQYPTLSLSYWITSNLFIHLTKDNPECPLEGSIKKQLLEKFNYYFNTNVTQAQRSAKLLAAYLDPLTLQDLSAEETNEAELLIMRSAKNTPNAKYTTSSATIASSSSSSSSINPPKQSKMSTLERFRMLCHSSSPDAESALKPNTKTSPLTLKQEFSLHVSASTSATDFKTYWNDNKNRLPILSSYSRRYNCVPATSAASESAFSVAGYIDRKQRASLSTTTLRYQMLLK